MDISKIVKNLGVLLDSTLSMKNQINKVVKEVNYHLRNIAFVKKYIDKGSLTKLIHNHVISRIDYCNSLYYGLPDYLLRKLQLLMNRAARLIEDVPFRDRITPILIRLHWLPVKARIVYKICVLVFQAITTGKPVYIRTLLANFEPDMLILTRHGRNPLWLEEPRCRLQLGFRSFRVSAPRLFNRLPDEVKRSSNMSVFKRKLKTFLFGDCYTDDFRMTERYRIG